MFMQRIQTFATTTTMFGVWANLYINYKRSKKERNEKS